MKKKDKSTAGKRAADTKKSGKKAAKEESVLEKLHNVAEALRGMPGVIDVYVEE